MTATAGYRGQGAVSPSAGPPSAATPPRPNGMFCERGLTDAYCFSRHSYSAFWAYLPGVAVLTLRGCPGGRRARRESCSWIVLARFAGPGGGA